MRREEAPVSVDRLVVTNLTAERRPQMQDAVSRNPNASVTALVGAVTVLLVWGVGVAGLAVPAEVASAFTSVAAAIILWIGRLERRILNGRVERNKAEQQAALTAPNTG
jgi:heme A synthase